MAPETDIVALARLWVGTPYRHRASALGAGCDCLGLLRGIWRSVHGAEPVALPPYRASLRDPGNEGALEAAAMALLVPAGPELASGDVLLFRLNRAAHARHCGIATGDGHFIHAQEGLGVVEMALSDGWAKRIVLRRRFFAHEVN
jgi:NlpC/P60 family putative phage cell wall peptidase